MSLLQVNGNDYFDVLRIQNVPFPISSWIGARITVAYEEDVGEITICFRKDLKIVNANLNRNGSGLMFLGAYVPLG